jgi:hypothetical protein
VEAGLVRDPGTPTGSGRRRGSDTRERDAATVTAATREAGPGADYAPFGKRARGPAAGERATGAADRPAPSAEQALRRVITALERCDAALTPSVLEQFPSVPVKLRRQLLTAVDNLRAKTAGLKV